eukprot:c5992_g1_i1 orf=3-230(-)
MGQCKAGFTQCIFQPRTKLKSLLKHSIVPIDYTTCKLPPSKTHEQDRVRFVFGTFQPSERIQERSPNSHLSIELEV